jgi:hypothetical protein
MTSDPFERAARREEREEIEREKRLRQMWTDYSSSTGVAIAIVVFGIPYLLIALIRASGWDFGSPTLPESLVEYFFGGPRRGFGIYTGWMLFLIWAWLITVLSNRQQRAKSR